MRQCKASLFMHDDDHAFLCAETPSEVAELVEQAIAEGRVFAQLTSGNVGDWNGKPIYVRAENVRSIGPPMTQNANDADED